MKLTDEAVAKALGWWCGKLSKADKRRWWKWERPIDHMLLNDDELPRFTTSLDAIVAEIEARGLWWQVKFAPAVRKDWEDTQANAGLGEQGRDAIGKWADASTAPLALCAALLADLKEQRP